MALIKCYECGKEISDAAPACPSCGAPKKEAPKKHHYITSPIDGKRVNTRMTKEEWEASIDRGVKRAWAMKYPKCPLCGGHLEKMSGVEGVFRGGIAGASKKHRCTSCGHLV